MISSALVKRNYWNNIQNSKTRGQKTPQKPIVSFLFPLDQASNGLERSSTSSKITITPLLPPKKEKHLLELNVKVTYVNMIEDEATCTKKETVMKPKSHPYILPVFMTQAFFKDTVWPRWSNWQKQERKIAICKFAPQNHGVYFKNTAKRKGSYGWSKYKWWHVKHWHAIEFHLLNSYLLKFPKSGAMLFFSSAPCQCGKGLQIHKGTASKWMVCVIHAHTYTLRLKRGDGLFCLDFKNIQMIKFILVWWWKLKTGNQLWVIILCLL